MISRIIFFTNALLLASAQHYEQGNYGHATSSQSIIRHDVAHDQQGYNIQPTYHQPITYHSSPVISHAPVTQYIAPVTHHAAPVTHNISPVSYNIAPANHYASISHNISPHTQYVRPTIQHYVAPVTYHSSPIVHQGSATALHRVSNYPTPAIYLPHSNYNNQHQYAHGHQDNYAHPKYEFEYSVQDTHTGDIKSQHEARDGDHVNGFYSLHEPDGTVRTVHYNVAGHSGFNAQVERTGHSTHAQPASHYAPQYVLAHH